MLFVQKKFVDILLIEEEITIKNSDDFKENMMRFLKEGKNQLILDLDSVLYLNSSALGIIAQTAMDAKKRNKELVISGIKPPISEIFDIVKFDTFMHLFPTLEEAEYYYEHKLC